MENIVQNETNAFGSFQTTYNPDKEDPPELRSALEAWAQSSGYQFLSYWNTNTPPIVKSMAPLVDPTDRPIIGGSVPEAPTWLMALLGFAGLGPGLSQHRVKPKPTRIKHLVVTSATAP